MRRNLIIISIVIVILGLGVLAYFILTANKPSLSVTGGPTLPGAGTATGSTGSTGTTGQGTTSTTNSPPSSTTIQRLEMIDAGPIVPGEAVLDVNSPTSVQTASTSTGTTPSTTPDIETLFIKRESGNVFSYLTDSGIVTRTSNRTIPGIEEASWLSNGLVAAVRYLSGNDFNLVNTYLLSADGSNGSFLSQNLADISTASSTILTVASGTNGSIGTLTRGDGSQIAQVFSTPLSDIRATFAGKNQYLVFTKPSQTLNGYAFLVDAKGNFSRVAGPLNGLVALASPSGKWVLVSFVDSGAMKLELIDAATHETIPLPVGTIADKCAWTADESAVYCGIPTSPDASYAYPDDWYQGAAHFSDRIWKIDVTGRFAQLTLDFTGATQKTLDATALSIDPAGKQLVFVNKNDGSLWRYEI